MNKTDHIVHSGWMIKSPPEKKLLGPWKLFRSSSNAAVSTPQKWKKRFFVLSKPAGSLPGQYVLSYYSDDLRRRRKGYIDLEQCEQIIESLASEQHQFLFSIKTFHKSRDRTYFLGTENEADMIMWVRSLCQVCGLKQEDSPDLPPPSHKNKPTPPEPPEPPEIRRSEKQRPVATVAPRVEQDLPPPVTSQPVPMGVADESPYLLVSDCHSGRRRDVDKDPNRSSIPDEIAPSPPTKENDSTGASFDSAYSRDSNVSIDSLYKVPPRAYRLSDEFYDVPPPRHVGSASPHSSSGESHTGDSMYASDIYKFPPAPRQFTPPNSRSSDEMKRSSTECYDSLPPTRSVEAPPRPPRVERAVYQNEVVSLNDTVPLLQQQQQQQPQPPQQQQQQQHKQQPATVTRNEVVCLSDAVPLPHRISELIDDEEYQVPPSNISTDLLLHGYMNTGAAHSDKPVADKDGYLAMNHGAGRITNGMDQSYTDMSGGLGPPDEMTSSRESDVYQYPSPCPRPVRPNVPPRNRHTLGDEMAMMEDDSYSIFSSERTRSFKKINGIDELPSAPPKPASRTPKAPPTALKQKPQTRNNTTKTAITDSDQEAIMYDLDKNLFIKRTPPAPKKSESDLKYLDLDNQFDSKEQAPKVTPISNSTPTEYREIDFIKTQALSDTKKIVEGQRKT